MKNLNRLIRVLIATLLSVSALGVTAAMPHQETEEVHRQLSAAYPDIQIDSVWGSEIPGLYELHVGKDILYATKERYLLVGHIYDTKVRRNLTLARLMIPEQWPANAAIRLGNPAGRKLAVFTDPDCPWCRKLQGELEQLKEADVHEFLYPLRPESPAKARAIWCSQDRHTSLVNAMQGGNVPAPDDARCDISALEQAVAFGQSRGFQETPTLVRGDGEVWTGYLTLEQLRKWLAETTETKEEGQ
ncbi:MAG: DsbC family protein [Gammaproteobacteria bacterium]|nr:DsbC family protein [Gammaproteobacteria bacterium]